MPILADRTAAISGGPFTFHNLPADASNITQRFGENPEYYQKFGLPYHLGVDFGLWDNDPVYSVAPGTAVLTNRDPDHTSGFGIHATIRHGPGRRGTLHHDLRPPKLSHHPGRTDHTRRGAHRRRRQHRPIHRPTPTSPARARRPSHRSHALPRTTARRRAAHQPHRLHLRLRFRPQHHPQRRLRRAVRPQPQTPTIRHGRPNGIPATGNQVPDHSQAQRGLLSNLRGPTVHRGTVVMTTKTTTEETQ